MQAPRRAAGRRAHRPSRERRIDLNGRSCDGEIRSAAYRPDAAASRYAEAEPLPQGRPITPTAVRQATRPTKARGSLANYYGQLANCKRTAHRRTIGDDADTSGGNHISRSLLPPPWRGRPAVAGAWPHRSSERTRRRPGYAVAVGVPGVYGTGAAGYRSIRRPRSTRGGQREKQASGQPGRPRCDYLTPAGDPISPYEGEGRHRDPRRDDRGHQQRRPGMIGRQVPRMCTTTGCYLLYPGGQAGRRLRQQRPRRGKPRRCDLEAIIYPSQLDDLGSWRVREGGLRRLSRSGEHAFVGKLQRAG